ncbi:MAG TPA: hypothetical protein VMV02_01195 [Acidimicrobiales bacterium]|nr:hypothetical protein [Acidimicrobiales bacterium]
MTTTDYAIDIALIAIVALQMRGRRLTTRSLLLPVVIVMWAAFAYLHGIPTAGNDLTLAIAGAALGVTLGALCARFTTVTADERGPIAKAGVVAGVLWVLGVGTRFAFQLYATHGGGETIVRFSAAHDITSTRAWVAALLLMAIGEALARTVVLARRAHRRAPAHVRPSTAMIGGGGHVR